MSALLDQALAKVDQALSARPRGDPHALSDATQALCRHRQELVAAGAKRAELETLNAVISVVLAAHYPIGATPWPELQAARGWLDDFRVTSTTGKAAQAPHPAGGDRLEP